MASMNPRPFPRHPPFAFTRVDWSTREVMTTAGGNPESVDSSDPDTEKYFAASEGSNDTNSAHTSDTVSISGLRSDSAAPYPLVRCHARSDPPYHRPMPSGIHPALRSPVSSGDLTFSMIDVDETVQQDPPNSPVVRAPATLPPTATTVNPKDTVFVLPNSQPKRKLSTIFRFGQHKEPNWPLSTPQFPAQEKTNKIATIRKSLSNLNLKDRIRRAAAVGIKRTHPTSPSSSSSNQPPRKAQKTLIHCQTCQCRAAVLLSLSRLHLHDSQVELPVASAAPTHMAMCPHPDICASHTSMFQNDDSLASLECRSPIRQRRAPAALTRPNPNGDFSEADKRRLLECVVAYEGIAALE